MKHRKMGAGKTAQFVLVYFWLDENMAQVFFQLCSNETPITCQFSRENYSNQEQNQNQWQTLGYYDYVLQRAHHNSTFCDWLSLWLQSFLSNYCDWKTTLRPLHKIHVLHNQSCCAHLTSEHHVDQTQKITVKN